MKKFLSFLCVVALIVCTVSCSKSGKNHSDEKNTMTEDEINQKYDDYFGDDKADKPLSSDASVLGEDFSSVDFTFTSADGTNAFNLSNNSYAIISHSGTSFGSLISGEEAMTFDGGYKTARGVGLETSAKEILEKYKISDSNAVFVKPDDSVYYTPTNGVFDGTLTVIFASADSISYGMLPSGDVQKFIYARNSNSGGAYVDPNAIMSTFSDYKSIVSIDITANGAGIVERIAFYKFDK